MPLFLCFSVKSVSLCSTTNHFAEELEPTLMTVSPVNATITRLNVITNPKWTFGPEIMNAVAVVFVFVLTIPKAEIVTGKSI